MLQDIRETSMADLAFVHRGCQLTAQASKWLKDKALANLSWGFSLDAGHMKKEKQEGGQRIGNVVVMLVTVGVVLMLMLCFVVLVLCVVIRVPSTKQTSPLCIYYTNETKIQSMTRDLGRRNPLSLFYPIHHLPYFPYSLPRCQAQIPSIIHNSNLSLVAVT
jgi:hypothetical protein